MLSLPLPILLLHLYYILKRTGRVRFLVLLRLWTGSPENNYFICSTWMRYVQYLFHVRWIWTVQCAYLMRTSLLGEHCCQPVIHPVKDDPRQVEDDGVKLCHGHQRGVFGDEAVCDWTRLQGPVEVHEHVGHRLDQDDLLVIRGPAAAEGHKLLGSHQGSNARIVAIAPPPWDKKRLRKKMQNFCFKTCFFA